MTTTGIRAPAYALDEATVPIRNRPAAVGTPRSIWQARYVALLVPVDAAVGLVAALAAVLLRFGPAAGESQRVYAWLTALLPVGWLLALLLNRAYESRCLFAGNEEYQRVLRAGLALTATIALVLYAFEIRLGRSYLLVGVPALLVLGVLARYAQRRSLHRRWARGECLRRVLVVGHACAVADLTRRLRRERHHGMDVVGACLPAGAATLSSGSGAPAGAVPVLGTFDDVAMAAWQVDADTVVVLSCPELDGTAVRRLAWRLERDDVDLVLANALIDVDGGRATVRPVDGLPMLHVDHPRLGGVRRVVKSVVDRLTALFLLVLLIPLLVAVAALVRWQPGARGPALDRQARVGRGGREFQLLKFRTRYAQPQQGAAGGQGGCAVPERTAGQGGAVPDQPAGSGAPPVTPLGRWLRRFSLAALPQLANVVRGEMSLVGPRPPRPDEVARHPDDMRRRLVVKPGMTGLWQVSRGVDLSSEEALRLDLRYVENWSLTLDLVVVLRTVTAVARSAGEN
ncbi:MAG TPA: exopolysaccharide biosynthesis polyprenyl glycosylphosphotransferase [Micromonosporaceae bacterium]|nr:exopolysaccharide biosynthesis polyprenyl glycosylphosphotransferase [Micromonosporaceae bacterium]